MNSSENIGISCDTYRYDNEIAFVHNEEQENRAVMMGSWIIPVIKATYPVTVSTHPLKVFIRTHKIAGFISSERSRLLIHNNGKKYQETNVLHPHNAIDLVHIAKILCGRAQYYYVPNSGIEIEKHQKNFIGKRLEKTNQKKVRRRAKHAANDTNFSYSFKKFTSSISTTLGLSSSLGFIFTLLLLVSAETEIEILYLLQRPYFFVIVFIYISYLILRSLAIRKIDLLEYYLERVGKYHPLTLQDALSSDKMYLSNLKHENSVETSIVLDIQEIFYWKQVSQ